MQFVPRGNKIQVYKYTGYNKEKKRPVLSFLGSMEKDGKPGWKLEMAISKLDEKDRQEFKEKQRVIKQAAILGGLPWQLLEVCMVMQKMSNDEIVSVLNSKDDEGSATTWQERIALYFRLISEAIAANARDEKIYEFFSGVRDAYLVTFNKPV